MQNNLNYYMTVEDIAFKWHVEEYIIYNWCIQNKVEALFTEGAWLVATNQDCPLLTFDEFSVDFIDVVVEEFSYDEVSRIFFENNSLFSDFIVEDDGYRLNENARVIVYKTENQQSITEEELNLICYHCYLFDYHNNTGVYPIFLKSFDA